MSNPIHLAKDHRASFALGTMLVIAVAVALVLFISKQNVTQEKLLIQQELKDLSAQQKQLTASLEEAQITNVALDEKLQAQEANISSLTLEIQDRDRRQKEAEKLIMDKETEIKELRNLILRIEDEKRELESRLEKQYQEYYEMKSQLGLLLKTKEELEQRAKELAENGPVSLGTVVVRQNPARN